MASERQLTLRWFYAVCRKFEFGESEACMENMSRADAEKFEKFMCLVIGFCVLDAKKHRENGIFAKFVEFFNDDSITRDGAHAVGDVLGVKEGVVYENVKEIILTAAKKDDPMPTLLKLSGLTLEPNSATSTGIMVRRSGLPIQKNSYTTSSDTGE